MARGVRSRWQQGCFPLRFSHLSLAIFFHSLHIAVHVSFYTITFSFLRDIGHIELKPTHMISFYLYVLKDPVSKYCHNLKCWRLGL
jgi:hypothetical protein